MLDVKFICENLDKVKKAMNSRSGNYDVDIVAELYNNRRIKIKNVEDLKAQRNSVSGQIAVFKKEKKNADNLIKQMKEVGEEIKELDNELNLIEEKLQSSLLSIPNIPNSDVPVGKSDEDNIEIRKWGKIREFDFEPKPHWITGENLDILDPATAAKISGARFTVYKGLGAKLERAVINLMLDTHSESGYTEVLTPFLANKQSMTGTGQLPKFEEDMFAVKNTEYYLIPTAEVPVTNIFRNEILSEDKLPVCFCAYSACFRAEAGSAGRDTRGLIRQHQFNKVELVKFCKPEESYIEHEKLTNDAEKILQLLNIPYRVSLLCSGDLGFSAAKTYDIEVWMPSYNRYVEISSCSNYESYQARRANIKYKSKNSKPEFVHTLNGSGLAVGRTVAAILENYQNADGSITVPEVLRKYLNCDIIK